MTANHPPRVGVLIGHIETPYARTLLHGMMRAAAELPANLLVFPGMFERAYIGTMRKVDDTTENFMFSQIFDYAVSQNIDRLIISPDTIKAYVRYEAFIQTRQKFRRVPILVLESAEESPHILVDSAPPMRETVGHLVKTHGFTRIGYIGGTEGNYGARVRYEAFLSAMGAHGLEPPEGSVVHGDYTLHSGLKAAERILARCPDIQAICCANDWMAMGCCQALRAKGLEPGRDVMVTGFDDVAEAGRTDPPLTTVRAHVSALGYEAVMKVCALSEADRDVPPFSHAPDFVVRNSCGCGIKTPRSSCTSKRSGKPPRRQDLPRDEAGWTEFLVRLAESDAGIRVDENLLRDALGTVVGMVLRAVASPEDSLSLASFRSAFHELASADIYRDTMPSALRAVQYFLMSLMRSCSDEMAPKLIHFAQRVTNYTIHAYDAAAHSADDQQKKRLRFITSMARDVLQQEDKVDRLWHKLFYSVKNLKLGNIWVFCLDDPHPMNPQVAMGVPWEDMKLVGYHVERDITIYHEQDRPKVWQIPKKYFEEKTRSVICYPLFAAREVYGVMAVEALPENLPTLFAIAIQAGTALQYIFLEREQKRLIRILNDQSQQFERKATQDELTGLLNRFGFVSRVDSTIAGHNEERAILAFADLDHLKHINDTLGHAAGDAAITTAADLLRQGFGPSAVIGRMGGDEFVVFSCLRPGEKPGDMLDKVRELSAAYNAKSRKPYYVEISLGVTEFLCSESINLSQLLKKADDCLYEAKQRRRTTSIRQEA